MSTLRTADGLDLYHHQWIVESPKAHLGILHGYGEHGERYAHLAKALNEVDVSVLGVDLRGHGRSSGVRGHVDRFNDYHQDATALYEKVVEAANGGPVFMLGHSMGGLLVFDWLNSGISRPMTGLIVSSPFLGVAIKVNPIKKALGNMMSGLYPPLAIPSGLQGKDVTRDADEAKAYDSDPLNNSKATARWYTEAMAAIDRVHDGAAAAISSPFLMLYGGDDRVVSANATERFAKGIAGEDSTVERLDGYFHELINEPEEYRRPVIEQMKDWILSRSAG